MRRRTLVGLILSIILVVSCSMDDSVLDAGEQPTIRNLTSSEQILVKTSQNFGLNLFKSVNQSDTSDNILISPLSVSLALGMTLNGAAGQTYDDMKSTLELNGLSENEINEAYKSLINLLLNLDERVIFKIANSIWADEGFNVLQSFLDVNTKYFNSETKSLDFSRSDAVNIINDWISEKTQGKIEDMLDQIPPGVVMYLINAIYFKALWTYQFDEENTSIRNFYTTPDNPNECSMMKIRNNWLYYEDDDVQIVDLPYGDSLYSMTVLLPAQDLSVDDFIAQITPESWTSYFETLEYDSGTVSMPKLKLDYKLLMNDVLKSMGMTIAFTPSADFSRINGYGGLYISRVIHQSFIQVDEEGTEAAAATIVEMFRSSISDGFIMYINRPYLFVIRERINNTIIFIGKITKPVWAE